MAAQIIFHIGLEKTGTDSFQRFCTENRRALRSLGILYPVGLAFAEHSHGPLAACYLPYRDLSVGPGRARADVLHSLRAEIERARPETVLISAEHLSSRFRSPEIEQLARDFNGFDCRIAVVVREHASRIRSAYAQTILAGRTPSFEDYCREILDPANPYVRYRDTIAPWDRVFGRETMRVFSLTAGTDVVGMLRAALIPRAAAIREQKHYRDNQSQGASAVEALRLVTLQLPDADPRLDRPLGRLKWLLLRLARRRIRALLATAAGGREQGRFQLSTPIRARLQEIVDIDRQWLESSYGIRLGTPDTEDEPPVDETLAKRLAAQVTARPWVKVLMAMR